MLRIGTIRVDSWMPSDLPTICRERERLLDKYREAANEYSRSVQAMADLVTSGDEVRANEARRLCRASWDAVEKSRLALSRHEADHNCSQAVNTRNVSGT